MYRHPVLRFVLSLIALSSIMSLPIPAHSQDLVASDDVSGGASVFVFRKSSKAPHAKAAGRPMRAEAASGRANRNKFEGQVATNRKRRTTQSTSPQVARNRPAARNTKAATAQALVAKGDSLLEAKQTDQAIASYRDALKADPRHAGAKAGLSDALTAKALVVAGDTNSSAATVYLDEAITLDPQNDVAYAKLGDVATAAGDGTKARTNYEKAIQINPELGFVYVPLGVSYANAGEIAKAETAVQNAEKRGVADAELYNLKGLVLYKQNKNTEALAAFEKAISLEGRNATAKYYRAAVLDRMDQPEQSLATYRETVAIAPDYSPAWYDMGVAYYNRGDYQNALSAYNEAVKVDPTNYQAHWNLASTYRQMNQFAEANTQFARAEVGIKTQADLYSEWGYSLGKTGQWDEAIARLEQARRLSPNAVDDTNAGWGYYNAAQVDKQNKRDADANAKFQKSRDSHQAAVQKDPKLDAAYVNLGSANNALGNHQAAVAALNIALSLRSDWVIAINQLGLGYRGLNNLPMALTQFNRVVTLDGNNVAGLFNLGSTQHASGDKKGAKKTQERLKRLNPALAEQLGNVIAGKIIEAGTQEVKRKIPVRLPF